MYYSKDAYQAEIAYRGEQIRGGVRPTSRRVRLPRRRPRRQETGGPTA
ncbi:hypothetical protein [Nocardioides sp. SYSU D00038]|nr:hypothetical protein [Nocardioides sp. SYSU D00038]